MGALLIFSGDPQICIGMCETPGFFSGIGLPLLSGNQPTCKGAACLSFLYKARACTFSEACLPYVRVLLCHVPLCPLLPGPALPASHLHSCPASGCPLCCTLSSWSCLGALSAVRSPGHVPRSLSGCPQLPCPEQLTTTRHHVPPLLSHCSSLAGADLPIRQCLLISLSWRSLPRRPRNQSFFTGTSFALRGGLGHIWSSLRCCTS